MRSETVIWRIRRLLWFFTPSSPGLCRRHGFRYFTSGLSSETPETERASRDVWRPSNPTYHWNLALHCGRSRRMVYTSLSGGWDLYLHDWVLCLDEPGNPFPLLILSSRDMSK